MAARPDAALTHYTGLCAANLEAERVVAKYLVDISKLAFAAIVIGKFVSANPIPIWVFVVGLMFSLLTLTSHRQRR